MTRLTILFLSLFFTCNAGQLLAQDDEGWKRTSEPAPGEKDPYEMKTLLGNKKIRHGAYLAFHMMGTQIDKQDGLLVGGRLAWILNHRLAVGVAGYGLANSVNISSQEFNSSLYDFNMGYGGLLIEPIIGSGKPIHVSFPVLLGAGGASFQNNLRFYDQDNQSWTGKTTTDDSFFLIEPGAELELNVFRFFRLSTGVSYRYVTGFDLGDVKDEKLNGLSVGVALKFGIF